MFRKVLVAGGTILLSVSALTTVARAQEGAPVPTTPTSTTLSVGGSEATTSTSQPATTVERSNDGVANTGPHDYIGWLSLAGVISVAAGISMRGRRADGNHWRG